MAKKIYVLDTSVCLTDSNCLYSFANNDIVLDLGGGKGGAAWYIEIGEATFRTYMKDHARAYIHNGFFYIDDTGEYGPYSIPIQMIDNLVNGMYTCPQLKITWNDETKTNEIEEVEEVEEEEE